MEGLGPFQCDVVNPVGKGKDIGHPCRRAFRQVEVGIGSPGDGPRAGKGASSRITPASRRIGLVRQPGNTRPVDGLGPGAVDIKGRRGRRGGISGQGARGRGR